METIYEHISNCIASIPYLLLSPASKLSIPALASALLIGASFLVFRRGLKKETNLRALMRALFPRRIWLSPSTKLDYQYVFANLVVFTLVASPALLSFKFLKDGMYAGLNVAFGPTAPTTLPEWASVTILTVALYLAYEIAYWVDHYLSHKIPFLWEFHKVHHAATVLTPFTNWRVHPIDTVVFLNLIAFFSSIATALCHYGLGQEFSAFKLLGSEVFTFVYFYTYGHLQHSHLWIGWRGWAGRIFMSPAHHQIHHSNDAGHHDRNFGGSLCLLDWLFGTLHMPEKRNQRLVFGLDDGARLQRMLPSLYHPFAAATGHALRLGRKGALRLRGRGTAGKVTTSTGLEIS
jgi:sterol desaturase/sphingolipid hydroxylase (fatty acid hydroxylase superfamily)